MQQNKSSGLSDLLFRPITSILLGVVGLSVGTAVIVQDARRPDNSEATKSIELSAKQLSSRIETTQADLAQARDQSQKQAQAIERLEERVKRIEEKLVAPPAPESAGSQSNKSSKKKSFKQRGKGEGEPIS